jgi:alkylated DNA repair dioxygenase AlkB
VKDFLSPEGEQKILNEITALPMAPFHMRGVTSKRLVLHFGWDYNYDAWQIMPATPMPPFLLALRDQAVRAFGHTPSDFEEALINGYPAGAGIGWHRDAPMFASPVIGISLASDCVMRFRKKAADGYVMYRQGLEARSLYAMAGESRSAWQHMIPPAKALRYSITFRIVVRKPKASSSPASLPA